MVKKSIFFVVLLGIWGCYNYRPPSNPYVKLKEEIDNSLAKTTDLSRVALEGIGKLQKFLKDNPKSKYTEKIDGYILYLAFRYLTENKKIFLSICKEFIKKYPRLPSTATCLYKAGEMYYYQEKYKSALGYFDQLIQNFPGNRNLKKATLWKTLISYETMRYKECVQDCTYFLKQWPRAKEKVRVQNLLAKAKYALRWKGKKAPVFVKRDILGRWVDFKSWKGHVVFLVFWSFKQGDRERLFQFKELQNQFGGKNFRLVAIAIQRARSTREAVDKVEENISPSIADWIHLYCTKGLASRLAKSYELSKTPTNFLIDQKGVIQGVDLWGKSLKKAIEALLE